MRIAKFPDWKGEIDWRKISLRKHKLDVMRTSNTLRLVFLRCNHLPKKSQIRKGAYLDNEIDAITKSLFEYL